MSRLWRFIPLFVKELRFWSPGRDLNPGPTAYEAAAFGVGGRGLMLILYKV